MEPLKSFAKQLAWNCAWKDNQKFITYGNVAIKL